MKVAVVIVAALLLFPLVGRSVTTNSWQGITLGESVHDVTAAVGPPLLLRLMPDGSHMSWHRTASQDAFMLISERDDHVTMIRLAAARSGVVKSMTDLYGVSLGDTADHVAAVRGKPSHVYQTPERAVGYDAPGAVGVYILRDGNVHAMMLVSTEQPPASRPASPMRDPHNGSSPAAAYILNAKDEGEGVQFEHFYISTMGGCDGDWTMTKQSLISQKDRNYDALELTCSDGDKKMVLYFDITSFFGKLGD